MRRAVALTILAITGCTTPIASPPTFFVNLSTLCGKAFEGRIVSPPVAADASFAGKRLVMHVRDCSADTIRIPFHVGDDRSRTWVVTRTTTGYRLKHDHRHADGSEDTVTQYGGDSVAPVTAVRQEFPADAFTRALLLREGNAAGVANVWAIDIEPARMFAYELRRPGRFFRVEFDLTRPVAAPRRRGVTDPPTHRLREAFRRPISPALLDIFGRRRGWFPPGPAPGRHGF